MAEAAMQRTYEYTPIVDKDVTGINKILPEELKPHFYVIAGSAKKVNKNTTRYRLRRQARSNYICYKHNRHHEKDDCVQIQVSTVKDEKQVKVICVKAELNHD